MSNNNTALPAAKCTGALHHTITSDIASTIHNIFSLSHIENNISIKGKIIVAEMLRQSNSQFVKISHREKYPTYSMHMYYTVVIPHYLLNVF